MSDTDFTGLLPETSEAKQAWRDKLVALPPMAGDVKETLFSLPPPWIKIENQGQTNSCAPNAGTSCLEKLVYMQTGSAIQLSRNYLYLRGQQLCGIRGDSGCTLGGIQAAMKKYGAPPETLWPFNQTYQTKIPQGCDEAAAKYKATKTLNIEATGYDGFRIVIGQNIGSVEMATRWPVALTNGYRVERYRPLGRGGHAIAGLFLSDVLDSDGRPYVWVANSHSVQAQKAGWMLWSPTAIDELIESDDWGVFGVTDMITPAPREVSYDGEDNPFRPLAV